MAMHTLEDLFLEELQDLYDAENQMLKALPKMAQTAHNAELRHGFEHPRLRDGAQATRELVEEAVVQILEVEARGEGRIAQLLDLVALGDWTSCYLALDNDVDPGPIDAITQLKSSLAP